VDDLELRHNHIKQLADVFTHNPQITAAIGAIITWVKLTTLARGIIRDTGTAAGFALSFFGRGLHHDRVILIKRRGVHLGDRNQQIFQCQLKLFDLTLNLL